jgi:hypothetical protein
MIPKLGKSLFHLQHEYQSCLPTPVLYRGFTVRERSPFTALSKVDFILSSMAENWNYMTRFGESILH